MWSSRIYDYTYSSEELQQRQKEDPLLAVVLEHFLQKPTRAQLGQRSKSAMMRAVLKVYMASVSPIDDGVPYRFGRDSPEDGQELKQLLVQSHSL